MTTTNSGIWYRFLITCEWKGKTATFIVDAPNADTASEWARQRCKKAVGMPPSSVYKRAFQHEVPAPSGQMDRTILQQKRDEIMYNRKVN